MKEEGSGKINLDKTERLQEENRSEQEEFEIRSKQSLHRRLCRGKARREANRSQSKVRQGELSRIV